MGIASRGWRCAPLVAVFVAMCSSVGDVAARRQADVPFTESVIDFFQMQCTRKEMRIALSYNRARFPSTLFLHNEIMIRKSRPCINGIEADECCARRHAPSQAQVLHVNYTACGVEMRTSTWGLIYRAKVVLTNTIHRDEYNVSCIVPYGEYLDIKTAMPIHQSFRKLTAEDNVVSLDTQLVLSPYFPRSPSPSFHLYPYRCWTTNIPYRNKKSQERAYFVYNGCPNDRAGTFPYSLFQKSTAGNYAYGPTQLYVTVSRKLVFEEWRRDGNESTTIPLYVHCDMVTCSDNKLDVGLGVQPCPSAFVCRQAPTAWGPLLPEQWSLPAVTTFPLHVSMPIDRNSTSFEDEIERLRVATFGYEQKIIENKLLPPLDDDRDNPIYPPFDEHFIEDHEIPRWETSKEAVLEILYWIAGFLLLAVAICVGYLVYKVAMNLHEKYGTRSQKVSLIKETSETSKFTSSLTDKVYSETVSGSERNELLDA